MTDVQFHLLGSSPPNVLACQFPHAHFSPLGTLKRFRLRDTPPQRMNIRIRRATYEKGKCTKSCMPPYNIFIITYRYHQSLIELYKREKRENGAQLSLSLTLKSEAQNIKRKRAQRHFCMRALRFCHDWPVTLHKFESNCE